MEPTIYVKPQPGQAVEVQYQESEELQELRQENARLKEQNFKLFEKYDDLRQQRLRRPPQPMKIMGRDDRGYDFVLQILDMGPYHAIVQLPAVPAQPTIVGSFTLHADSVGNPTISFPDGLPHGIYDLVKRP